MHPIVMHPDVEKAYAKWRKTADTTNDPRWMTATGGRWIALGPSRDATEIITPARTVRALKAITARWAKARRVKGPLAGLTPQQRSEIARNAVNARWMKRVGKVSLAVADRLQQKPRRYAGTGRWVRTPEHREKARQAALKRWAKAGRRKA